VQLSSSQGSNESKRDTEKASAKLRSTRQAALQKIEDSIGRLHRLSMAIRKAGVRNPQSRIASFAIVNEEGEDINLLFENFVDRVLEARLSNLSPNLRQRLATSICFRRRRFLYNKSHRWKLAMPEVKRPQGNVGSKIILPSPGSTTTPKAVPLAAPNRTESALRTDTTASAFDPMKLPLPVGSAPSQASSTPSVSPVLQSSAEIPRAPRLRPGMTEEECQYCAEVLPARQFLGTRWK
jgi:hypothetical protein